MAIFAIHFLVNLIGMLLGPWLMRESPSPDA